MASGRYTRVDGGSISSNYCLTVTLVVFAALCFAGAWMMMSSSVIPVQNVKLSSKDDKNGAREEVIESTDTKQQFGDFPGHSATKGDNNMNVTEPEHRSYDQEIPNNSEESVQNAKDGNQEKKVLDENFREGNHYEDAPETKMQNGELKYGEQLESQDGSISNLPDSNESGMKSLNQGELERSTDVKDEGVGSKKLGLDELLPSMAQSELLNETIVQNGSWLSQAVESNNEKGVQQYSDSQEQGGHVWKLCNITVGPDYIPCLDNILAIKKLRSRKHYEHRERHCPEVAPSCLVSLPEGYRRPIKWPVSRDKIWFHNVPHTQLVGYKGQQNWMKLSGEYLSFPGGGTQFPQGAGHYIEFIEEIAPDVRWGTRSRVVLDVGCGVASFGGYLFDKDVLTMSFAPKDEHEAQVQFALERGIPAMSAVMGSKRLPFSSMVFDVLHCARCRVPWHVEGGKLLLELNRLLRPGGFFVWSATPLYRKSDEDLKIRIAMEELTKSLCWELVAIKSDKINNVGVAVYRRPTSNDCFRNRSQTEPPFCQPSDDPNAVWDVPLQSCVHKVPESAAVRGSQWPEQWPARLEKPPYWLSSSQVGVYGNPSPEDFTSDYEHWKRVVRKSYLNGMGFSWSSVRNVMDMRAVYGGFAAALRDLNVWVMNVVSVDAPDTLPVIYERGLFGIYHDWCESFSTYPRSYDLLHANHLFSKIKSKCNLVALVVEVDRILRPEGWLIVRDTIEMMSELEGLLRSMQWEIRLNYSKGNESLMCAQKSWWRPTEVETIK